MSIGAFKQEKQIVSYLQGGLGNQLFIYSAGRGLADRVGGRFCLNTDPLRADVIYKRPYHLNVFQTRVDEILSPRPKAVQVLDKIRYKALSRVSGKMGNYYCEKRPYRFVGLPTNWHGVLTVDGYWQSERYFEDDAKKIVADLAIHDATWMQMDPMIKQISSSENSVFLHIRSYKEVPGRGDGSCALPLNYYKNSLDYLRGQLGQAIRVFCFSDDLPWAMERLSEIQGRLKTSLVPVYPIVNDSLGVSPELRDFMLMRLCKHGIVANSSFSWWAGWLGAYDWRQAGTTPIRVRVNRRCMNDDYWPLAWEAVDA